MLEWVWVAIGCIYSDIRPCCAIDFATLFEGGGWLDRRSSTSISPPFCHCLSIKQTKKFVPRTGNVQKIQPGVSVSVSDFVYLQRKCNSNSKIHGNFFNQILSINSSIFSFCLESFPAPIHFLSVTSVKAKSSSK